MIGGGCRAHEPFGRGAVGDEHVDPAPLQCAANGCRLPPAARDPDDTVRALQVFQLDRVIAKNVNPVGHTRLPRYVRGRRGVVARDHGVFVFPDTHAAGRGRTPQHVYSVRFAARELWGPDASPRDAVYVDLWDDYLEPDPDR